MAKADLTAARVRELLDYDPETGVFRWRVDRQGHTKGGDEAGHITSHGYVRITLDQQRVYAHRLAWLHVRGEWPVNTIDHINGMRHDNRFANLRDVSARVNSQNMRTANFRKPGRLLGAHWSKTWKRWKSAIVTNGRQVHLGWFDTEQQAHDAYIAAKRIRHEGCTI